MIRKKTSHFVNAKYKNARLSWNLLKASPSILLSTFEQYFRAVNNPDDQFYTPYEDVLYFNEWYEKNEFSIMFEELNIQFTHGELRKASSQLHTNKSAGPANFSFTVRKY